MVGEMTRIYRHGRRGAAAVAIAAALALAAIACTGSDSEPTAAPTQVAVSAPAAAAASGDAEALREAISALGAAAQTTTAAGASAQNGIWVTGLGSITLEADVARVSLGVESNAETVAEARESAASVMTEVLDAVRAAGVSDDDIVTTSFNIYPQQTWIEVKTENGTRSEPRITGYIVSNTVQVTVRSIDSVDDVIDGAADAGGDLIRINNVSFEVGDTSAYAEEVRRLATEDAQRKAQTYADAFGLKLGLPVYVQESGIAVPLARDQVMMARAESAMAFDSYTPIQSGDHTISVTVMAGFSILP